jgi:hypothetical protein
MAASVIRGWFCVAVLAASTTGCGGSAGSAAPGGTAREIAALQRTNALLQRQTELAAGKDFYLVFDPSVPDLALMLRGAELQRYPVRGVQVGRPRVAWFARQAAREWQGVVWAGGTLEPLRQMDRYVIQGVEPGKGEGEVSPPPIPPTAEELYPVPSRYLIRFGDGLSVEIRPREADEQASRWARMRAAGETRARDFWRAMWSSRDDAIRLRLVLNPKDAESLYRALPPAVRFVVLQ